MSDNGSQDAQDAPFDWDYSCFNFDPNFDLVPISMIGLIGICPTHSPPESTNLGEYERKVTR